MPTAITIRTRPRRDVGREKPGGDTRPGTGRDAGRGTGRGAGRDAGRDMGSACRQNPSGQPEAFPTQTGAMAPDAQTGARPPGARPTGDRAATAAYGDADVAWVARHFAEPARARVLMALADGRALPASVLADEAGISPAATSAHLSRLLQAGLLAVEPSGRHRYYRLAGPEVAGVLEALARIAPSQQVRSLRQGTKANALRAARTCYDHLAGQLGVDLTAGLADQGVLVPIDGVPGTGRRPGDPLSAQLGRHPYVLGPDASSVLDRLGVDLAAVTAPTRSRRPVLRFCMDWTEQRHHVAGRLGAAVAESCFRRGWVTRLPRQRAVRLTAAGADALAPWLGH